MVNVKSVNAIVTTQDWVCGGCVCHAPSCNVGCSASTFTTGCYAYCGCGFFEAVCDVKCGECTGEECGYPCESGTQIACDDNRCESGCGADSQCDEVDVGMDGACVGTNYCSVDCDYFTDGDANKKICEVCKSYTWTLPSGIPPSDQTACCGDDGSTEKFIKSAGACCNGNWYSGGDCCSSSDCTSDTCVGSCPGCVFRDYYCSSHDCKYTDRDPDGASSYCTGCGLDWLNFGLGTNDDCCGDDSGEDFEQSTASGRSCCYNANELSDGESSGSILCDDGRLYDCNGVATDDSDLATHVLSCEKYDDKFCTSSNKWVVGDCCEDDIILSEGEVSNTLICSEGQIYDCNSGVAGIGIDVSTCDEYGNRYCSQSDTWESGSSRGKICAYCMECGGTTSLNEGTTPNCNVDIYQCNANTIRCNGDWAQKCTDEDGNGCPEWNNKFYCPNLGSDFICDNPSCGATPQSCCIDDKPPVTSIKCNYKNCLGDCWYQNVVTISLSCSDGGTGCYKTYYCYDETDSCTPNIEYSKPFNVPEGLYYLRYLSGDNAGNMESINSQVVKSEIGLEYEDLETTVNVIFLGSEEKSVQLSLDEINPPEPTITVEFNPDIIIPPITYNSKMTIKTTSATPAGIYAITIKGTGNGITKTATYILYISGEEPYTPEPPPSLPPSPPPSPPPSSVDDYEIFFNPSSYNIIAGESTTSTITADTVPHSAPFGVNLELGSITTTSGETDAGNFDITVSFVDGWIWTYWADINPEWLEDTMTITTESTTPADSYLITVKGRSGTAPPVERTKTFSLVVSGLGPVCGDGKCEDTKGENCLSCIPDCGCGVGEKCCSFIEPYFCLSIGVPCPV